MEKSRQNRVYTKHANTVFILRNPLSFSFNLLFPLSINEFDFAPVPEEANTLIVFGPLNSFLVLQTEFIYKSLRSPARVIVVGDAEALLSKSIKVSKELYGVVNAEKLIEAIEDV